MSGRNALRFISALTEEEKKLTIAKENYKPNSNNEHLNEIQYRLSHIISFKENYTKTNHFVELIQKHNKSMSLPSWILTDDDWDSLGDYAYECLAPNGVINEGVCRIIFEHERFNGHDSICPFCNHTRNYYIKTEDHWKCANCRKTFSLTSKTYLDNTKIPLTHWFRFAYLTTEIKLTASYAIAKNLNISQKSAWLMIKLVKQARKEQEGKIFKNLAEYLHFPDGKESMIKLLLTVRKSTEDLPAPTND